MPDPYSAYQDTPATAPTDPYVGYQDPQDFLQRTLNNPSNAATGFLQGMGKGAVSTGYGLLDLANKVVPTPITFDPAYRESVTKPAGAGQGTGKFVEQALEYALPEKAVTKLMEGTSLAARIAAKAATGAGVAGAQSGGDPAAIATGTAFGGGGEYAGEVIGALRGAEPVPNLKNLARVIEATPTQKTVINDALSTLIKDGVVPAETLPEVDQTIKGKLSDLSAKYNALPASITAREYDPAVLKAELGKQMRTYQRGNVTSPQNIADVQNVQAHMDLVDQLAAQNPSGKLTYEDLKYLRDDANKGANFGEPGEKNSFYKVGNVDRSALDQIAPETTQLNRDWQKYTALDKVITKNLSQGKGGGAPSGLTISLAHNVTSPMVGAEAGAGVGAATAHLLGLSPEIGAVGGAVAGKWLYPKLAEPAMRMVQNAADSGALAKLSPVQMSTLRNLFKSGNSKAVASMLGPLLKGTAFETATGVAAKLDTEESTGQTQ